MPTSDDLLELADACAAKLDLDGKIRHIPSFSDAEEQCEAEYDELLEAIHEDVLFAPVVDEPTLSSIPQTPPFGGSTRHETQTCRSCFALEVSHAAA